MPGREDLIKQNTARMETRTKVENAGEQAPTAGEKPTYSSHRSLLGGNLDVASALQSIEFAVKGPLGDGALRNSVAYIRYWSRPGSKATAESASQTVDATQIDPGTDPQSELNRAITERYGVEREGAQIIEYTDDFSAAVVTENNGTATYISTEVLDAPGGAGRVVQTNVDSNTLVIDDDGNILEGFRETRFAKYNEQLSIDATEQKQRQSALSSQIPKTKDSGTTQSTIVANSSQKADTQTQSESSNYRTSGVGQLKPANPNGFVNIFSQIGKSAPGTLSKQIEYQGIAGPAQKGRAQLAKGGTLAKGMWQFLFNPSELEIVAGPEFKVAETWGVSDKGNSGQPLNWSHNKNAELKFNSVLLNGYVFGRKVEELEQGIFELFMAREGGGQAGPPVLEFVWGKRVFGPCVIKEISIKEKMWDEGEVVNAELSFVLEQIPEWTINDGYVDVARPGKIPMVYDATEPSGNVGAGTTAPPSNTPPGGGGASPDQKSNGQGGSTPTGLYKKCQEGGRFADAFKKLEGQVRAASTGGAEPPLKQRLFQLRSAYIPLYNMAKTSLGSEFTSRSTYANVIPGKLIQAMDIAIDFEDKKTGLNALTRNYYNAQSILQNAANSAYNASKAFSQSPQCVAERKKVDAITDQQEADKICRNKQAGGQCSWFNVPAGGRIKSCSGIELICGSDGYLKNASRYGIPA